MNKPEFFVTPGYGERNLRLFHYSQAVKIGNRVETAGQGGWNDDWKFPESITDEIAQAFRNVDQSFAVSHSKLRWTMEASVDMQHIEQPPDRPVRSHLVSHMRRRCRHRDIHVPPDRWYSRA